MSDNLVPEPQASVFDSVSKVLGDEEAARRVMANPQLAAGFPNGHPAPKSDGGVEMCACGRHPKSECEDGEHSSEDDIPLKAIDDIGRATAEDVKEALHQVIDPELGIDVIDLIEDECASTLAGLVEEFRIDWTWQPRWTMDKITPEGREQLAALGFNFDNMPKY